MTSITVTSTAELLKAYDTLANTAGGGTIQVVNTGEPYRLTMIDRGGDMEPVTITSADPDDQAVFSLIRLERMDNITFDNIEGSSTDDPAIADWLTDLHIIGSDNITIKNSYFHSTADGFLAPKEEQAETLSVIRNSDNFTFENNLVEGYYHGLQIMELEGAVISGNEIRYLQGDGIRGGGLQDLLIEDNYIHDFYGADQARTHSDMIQIWGTGATSLTQNVTITGNILDTGEGAASQSIFIRNEQMATGGKYAEDYLNISITDNLIYNGHQHGIYVADTTGLDVSNNTLLHDQTATVYWWGEARESDAPLIAIHNVNDGVITNNITSDILDSNSKNTNLEVSGNEIVKFDAWQSKRYVENHFVNAVEAGANDLRDLQLLPDSPWNGVVGSSISWADDTTDGGVEAVMRVTHDPTDRHEVTFDASLTRTETGYADDSYTYRWTLSDGSSFEGRTVTKSFDNPGEIEVTLTVLKGKTVVDDLVRDYTVKTKELIEIDFENGAIDLSDTEARIELQTGAKLVEGKDGGTGLKIGDGGRVQIDGRGELVMLDQFGLRTDLKITGKAGMLMRQADGFEIRVKDDGSVIFGIETNEGSFQISSDSGLVNSGEWVSIGASYSDAAGSMEIYVDGEKVAQGDASGKTLWSGNDLYLPHSSFNALSGVVDNIVVSHDPAAGGMIVEVRDEDAPPVQEPPVVVVEEPEEPPQEPQDPQDPQEPEDPQEPVAEEPPEEPEEPEEQPEEPEEPKAETPQQPAPAPAPEPDPEPEPEPGGGSAAEEDDDDGGGIFAIFTIIFDLIAAIFGGGGSDKKGDTVAETESADVLLSDLVPSTGQLDEELPEHGSEGEGQDEDFDLAA